MKDLKTYKILDNIAADYMAGRIGFVKRFTLKEEEEFYKKNINTAIPSEIEDDFNTAIIATQTQGFIDGFKVGVAFLNECITIQ